MKGEANKRVIGGRLIFVFIICVTMIIDSTITAVTISDALGNQRVSVPYVLSYTIHLKEPTFGSTQLASSEYTTVYMEGCLNIGEQAGDPLVPVKTVTLLLPPKKAMTSINVVGTPVSINPCDIDLKEKPILPYQKSIPIGS